MRKIKSRNDARIRRHLRLRKRVAGTSEIPRLCVFRSNKNIFAQVIDDVQGKTLVSASSLGMANGGNKAAAKEVGLTVGKLALSAGIKKVVFDRGGYVYHGRVAAVAEGAREAGLKF